MDKLRSIEEEKRERQNRILSSLNLDGSGSQKRHGSDRKKKSSVAQKRNEKGQCTVLGLVALILVTAAVFQEGRRSSESVFTEQNRIMTAEDNRQSGESENLILVNKEHGLPENYTVNLHWLQNGREAVADEIYEALSDMLTDGSADGREFVVASGYRSYEKQQQLLEEDIQASMEKYGLTRQEAYDKESQETMPQGHSEHETGLAVDLVALDYQILDEAQEYTEENQWLREHCQDYGFILRYPRGKEDVTGISYESWHFRYVGTEAAKEIMDKGITLEEYLEQKNQNV